MKTYVYARVSTEEQTLTQQLNAIGDYLRIRGMQIDELVSDEGVSGGISYKQRKLNDLLQDMSEGDALVVSEISRLGRSMSDLNKLVNDELKPRKLRLIIISMGMDLDCSNLKAIDEMILFAFGFSAQIEKEMIQERTRNALDARKKEIQENGFFISRAGNRCTRLGGGDTTKARLQSAKNRTERAKNNSVNIFLENFFAQYEKRIGMRLSLNVASREHWDIISNELNALGIKTITGLCFTGNRVKSLWVRISNRKKL